MDNLHDQEDAIGAEELSKCREIAHDGIDLSEFEIRMVDGEKTVVKKIYQPHLYFEVDSEDAGYQIGTSKRVPGDKLVEISNCIKREDFAQAAEILSTEGGEVSLIPFKAIERFFGHEKCALAQKLEGLDSLHVGYFQVELNSEEAAPILEQLEALDDPLRRCD